MANEQVTSYFKELSLIKVRDRSDMNARLENSAGKRSATAIRAALESDRVHDSDFIDLSCAQLKTALETACAADYDYLRAACEYIAQYSVGFGAKILDVGCGNGILSCFIARSYPAAQITAIDRNASAIKCASALAKRLGLSNITFIQTDLSDLAESAYNTVFSARILRENLLEPRLPEQDWWYDILAAEIIGQERSQRLTAALASHLAPDGCLYCLEDRDRDPQFYAYMTALNELEIGVIPQTCVQWDCETLFDFYPIQAFIAHKGSRLDHENLYWIWATLLSRGVDMKTPIFDGYMGDIFIRRIRSSLLRGMNFYDKEGKLVRKMLLWESNREQDADSIYLQQLNLSENTRSVECYTRDARKIVDGYYDRCAKGWNELGRACAPFTMNDRFEEIKEEI